MKYKTEITIHLLTPDRLKNLKQQMKESDYTFMGNDYMIIEYKDGLRHVNQVRDNEPPPSWALSKILYIETWFATDGYGYAELYINPNLPQKRIDEIVKDSLADDEGNDFYDTVNIGKEVLNNDSALFGLLGDTGKSNVKYAGQLQEGEIFRIIEPKQSGYQHQFLVAVRVAHSGYYKARVLDAGKEVAGIPSSDKVEVVGQIYKYAISEWQDK